MQRVPSVCEDDRVAGVADDQPGGAHQPVAGQPGQPAPGPRQLQVRLFRARQRALRLH